MAQYDVRRHRQSGQLVVDVQSDHLGAVRSRVVVPLTETGPAIAPAGRLNPLFEIEGRRYMLDTPLLSAVRETDLDPPIANFGDRFAEISGALDMLFHGF
jgi:toxin CcdB